MISRDRKRERDRWMEREGWSFTCMAEDPLLLDPTSAIHKAWQLCLTPKHQLKVVFLESIHQFPFHFNSLCSENTIIILIQRTYMEKQNHEVLTVISTNCHEISLPHQRHHMTITWPWSRALNNNSTRKLAPVNKYWRVQV